MKQKQSFVRITLLTAMLSLSVLVLNGCGFKARGSTYEELAGQSVAFVSSHPFGPLERSIRTQFANQAIVINEAETETGQSNQIAIYQTDTNKKTLSVDANGRPAEYLISIEVQLRFGFENQQQQLSKNFSASRDYRYDKNNTLAHDRELEKIVAELYDDLAGRIVNQYLIQLSQHLNKT